MLSSQAILSKAKDGLGELAYLVPCQEEPLGESANSLKSLIIYRPL